MKKKYHIDISFKWFDFWVGFFVDVPGKALYICVLPLLPIKIWITTHEVCPECGALMQKTAYDIAPEGFYLHWNCPACEKRGDESQIDIDWNMDFKNTEWVSERDLMHFNYEIR